MVLPNFIGIGASRSGSTWIDKRVRTHPDIYMPTRRKEIHFFDSYYDRGLEWYQGFFPKEKHAARFEAIGEFSPGYLSHPNTAERIHSDLNTCKFISIHRNPIDRAYSQWKLRVQKRGEKRSFEEYMGAEEEPFELGLYGKHLRKYFNLFPKERFLILVFERAIKCPKLTLETIGKFLGVNPSLFDIEKASQKLNASFLPRFKRGYHVAFKFKQLLRSNNMDVIVNFGKRLGAEHVFGRESKKFPTIDEITHNKLYVRFESDIHLFEELSGYELYEWRR